MEAPYYFKRSLALEMRNSRPSRVTASAISHASNTDQSIRQVLSGAHAFRNYTIKDQALRGFSGSHHALILAPTERRVDL